MTLQGSHSSSVPIGPGIPTEHLSLPATVSHFPTYSSPSTKSTKDILTTSSSNSRTSSETPASLTSPGATPLRIPKFSSPTTELLARVNGNGASISVDQKATMSNEANVSNATHSKPEDSIMPESKIFNKGDHEAAFQSMPVNPILAKGSSAIIDISAVNNSSGPNAIGVETTENLTSNITDNIESQQKEPKSTATNGAPTKPISLKLNPPSAKKRQGSTVFNGRNNEQKRSKRRKTRKNNEDDGVIKAGDSGPDGSAAEDTPVAVHTKSGRQIHRPSKFEPLKLEAKLSNPPEKPAPRKRRRVYRKGKETNIVCKHCERSHSSPSNVIVFCDDCNRAWHQFCHDPPIEKDIITVKESEWFCRECRPVEYSSDDDGLQSAIRNGVYSVVEYQNITPSQERVGGAHFSEDDRRSYLSGLSHNVLVNLLLEISNSSDTPIFPSNLSELPKSGFSPTLRKTPTTSKITIQKSPLSVLSDNGTTSTLTSIPSNSPYPLTNGSQSQTPQPRSSATTTKAKNTSKETKSNFTAVENGYELDGDDDDDDDDGEWIYVEDHRLYPRPGNGFRLPPDSRVLDMLLEDPSCPTFSHALHGPAKMSMEERRMQAVGSIA